MKYETGLKKGSLDRNLSVIISILGMSSFVIWTLLLVLLVIGNIIYWSGFPYDLGSTSEDALWGGWAHLLIIMVLILMIPISLIFGGSGILTFIGGMVHIRKQRPLVLTISFVFNLMILLVMIFIFLGSLLLTLPDRIPFSLFLLGPLILSYLARLILTAKVIFDHYKVNEKAAKSNLPSNVHKGISSV